MTKFSHFTDAIERIWTSGNILDERLQRLDGAVRISALARSSAERAALDLEDILRRELPFPQPRDMMDDEWSEGFLVSLRTAADTLALCAQQRPKDLQDWVRDTRLAIEEFNIARDRFRNAVEF